MSPFPETIPSWFYIAVRQVCFWPFPAQRLFSLDSSVVSNKAAINGLSCPTNPTPGQQKNCKASLWACYHYQMDKIRQMQTQIEVQWVFHLASRYTFIWPMTWPWKPAKKETQWEINNFSRKKTYVFLNCPLHPIFRTKLKNQPFHELFHLVSCWLIGRI